MSAETTSILDRFAWTAWRRQPQITVGHFPYEPLCRSCRRHPISNRFSKSRLCRPCRRDIYMPVYNRRSATKVRKRALDRLPKARARKASLETRTAIARERRPPMPDKQRDEAYAAYAAKLQSLGRCEALILRDIRWGYIPSQHQCKNNAYHHKTIGDQLRTLCGQHAKMRSDRLRLVQPAHAGKVERAR